MHKVRLDVVKQPLVVRDEDDCVVVGLVRVHTLRFPMYNRTCRRARACAGVRAGVCMRAGVRVRARMPVRS